MITKLSKEEWEALQTFTYQVEFDWIGLDKIGQLGIFSSVGTGFIPPKSISSFEKYVELCLIIDDMPVVTEVVVNTLIDANFSDWIRYSEKGFFAFDNQGSHDKKNSECYTLITVPKIPITIQSTSFLEQYQSIIPEFDFTFSGDIPFELLAQYK